MSENKSDSSEGPLLIPRLSTNTAPCTHPKGLHPTEIKRNTHETLPDSLPKTRPRQGKGKAGDKTHNDGQRRPRQPRATSHEEWTGVIDGIVIRQAQRSSRAVGVVHLE